MNNLARLSMYHLAGRVYLPRPRYLIYNATWRCDLACRHCGIWESEKRQEISAPELDRIVAGRDLFRKVDTAWFTGGEPTLRSDLKELAAVFLSRLPGLRMLGIASNGFHTERVMKRIAEIVSALDPARHGLFIQLSLDGTGEMQDRIRGKAGAFAALDATVAAINRLKRERPSLKLELGFNCVVQRANLSGLGEVRRYAADQGAGITFNLIEITDQAYRNRPREAELKLSDSEKQQARAFLLDLAGASSPALRSHYLSVLPVLDQKARSRRCLMLYSTLVIDSDGNWLPCPLCSHWQSLSFLAAEPESVWKGRPAAALRKKVERELCSQCMLSCSLGDSLSLPEFLAGGF